MNIIPCQQQRYINFFFYFPKSSSCLEYSHFPTSCNISTFIYESSIFVSSFCLCIQSAAKGLSYTVLTAQMRSRTPKYLQNKIQITLHFLGQNLYTVGSNTLFLLSSYRFSVFRRWLSFEYHDICEWLIIMLFACWSLSTLNLIDSNYFQELILYPQSPSYASICLHGIWYFLLPINHISFISSGCR